MTQDRLDRIEALLERFITASDDRMTRIERDIGDLRASISGLRDIIVGHERRVIRLEGRDVDLWGDYLTLAERIRTLEDWKRQQEGNRPSQEN
jgi:archaellum component FlaC